MNRSPQIEDDLSANESELHFNLKSFVVRTLIESEKHSYESVRTEDDTPIANSTNNSLIPDVQVGNRVYEVETLYSSGKPMNSIAETVKKYYESGKSPQINVVLKNIDALIWYEDLKQLEKGISEDWEVDVEFKIPIIREKRLGNIDEILTVLPENALK